MRSISFVLLAILAGWFPVAFSRGQDGPKPATAEHAKTPALLNLPMSGTDPARIDYAKLPTIKGKHAVISPKDPAWKFQLHSYLIHHEGRFWCMWSHGPGEDEPTQHVRYATSTDGLTWSKSKVLVGPPKEGYAYIARGLWVRDGELLALVAHFKGKGAFGVNKELTLQALAWDGKPGSWKPRGLVFDNAINNFPPEKVPTGQWMMTRRDSRFNVSVLIGGLKGVDDWRSFPVVERRKVPRFSPDEPIWYALPDRKLVGLFRDNGGSGRLFRSFSADKGRTWSIPVPTNFPNATSKIFSLRTSRGYRLLISNANPKVGRRQLHLSRSRDGAVYTRMALLSIPSPRPATLQYPHAIEHDGHVLIAFSRNKASIEVLKIPLREIEALRGKK
jgi:BNR repeat-like domain